jgi:hypothetical protein
MSRLFLVLLSLLWPALASAQMLPGGQAPPAHPGTRLNFPTTVGNAQMLRSYTTPIGRDVLYVYQYAYDRLQISIGLFDGGRRVPAGSENPIVTTQFANELTDAERTVKADGMTNFEKPAVPSSCTYGGLTYRCITYSALAGRDRLFSKLLLTGFRDYFLKIRADWSQGSGQTQADADRALAAFIPAVIR